MKLRRSIADRALSHQGQDGKWVKGWKTPKATYTAPTSDSRAGLKKFSRKGQEQP